jgi:hypothetical protein
VHYSHAIKIPASIIGFGFLGVEMASNAGILSSAGPIAVAITLMVTFAGAMAPVFAEHLWVAGHRAKALALSVFFLIVVVVSLVSALERTSGRLDDKVAAHDAGAESKALSGQILKDAERIQKRECVKDGSTACKRAEAKLAEARLGLVKTGTAAASATGDGGNKRIAQILGVSEDSVRLWLPWLIPIAVPFGACIFLGIGLSPSWQPPERPQEEREAQGATEPAAPVLQLPNSGTALQRLTLLLEGCGGQTRKSGNALADELGYPRSTFGLWLKRWSDAERPDSPIIRNDGWIKLSSQRRRRRA